jgi:pimeloyl-ACP methyl ester carboxylesterase
MPTSVKVNRGARVVADGVETRYHSAGDGPPLVLLHGSGPGVSSWSNWGASIPALAQRFRVVAIDMVGFGETERPDGLRYGSKTWTDHVVAVLEALNIGAANFIGNSLGTSRDGSRSAYAGSC